LLGQENKEVLQSSLVIFFCAKEDFSGYHNFAITYSQHKANARKFHKAMNKAKIFK